MLQSGIRQNNSDYALAGRQKVIPIMFTGKHDICKPLIVTDMRIRAEVPDAVKECIKRNESFDRSNDHTRGESGDYITETENKHLKGRLSLGVPTVQNWVIASTIHGRLQHNRNVIYEKKGIKDPSLQHSSVFKFARKIQMFRSMVQESNVLDNPYNFKPLQEVIGKIKIWVIFISS